LKAYRCRICKVIGLPDGERYHPECIELAKRHQFKNLSPWARWRLIHALRELAS
jgi:hypothetical protein